MAFVKKVVKDQQKYLRVLNADIPYSVETNGDEKVFKVGKLSLPYGKDSETGSLFIKPFGKKITVKPSLKAKHYKMRDALTDEKCRQLLIKALTPKLGYKPDLDNPKSFNEKINWMKFNEKSPLITKCCDKYSVKSYVSDIIGEEYVVPVLGVWDTPDQIDFDSLPEKFVIKVNWSSGYNIIIKDKSVMDKEAIKKQLGSWIKPSANSYYDLFNWGYKDMKPVIFAEKYIEQMDSQLYDYKFYYSKGEFLYLLITTDRLQGKLTETFYDENFQPLPFNRGNNPRGNPVPEMPQNLDKMLELGRKLAGDFSFVRIDFYETGAKEIYVGEITFYSGGGSVPFNPQKWDFILGEKIKI